MFTELGGEPVIRTDTIAKRSESTHLPLCFNHYMPAIFAKQYPSTPLLGRKLVVTAQIWFTNDAVQVV